MINTENDLTRLSINIPDRKVYVNDDERSFYDAPDELWNTFTRLCRSPFEFVGDNELQRNLDNQLDSSLPEVIASLSQQLQPREPSMPVIEKVTGEANVPGYQLNAKVTVVKL